MRKGYRTEVEITKEILELCTIPQGKTAIVYSCNLNFHVVARYLKRMIGKGTIERIQRSSRYMYQTTEQGKSTIDILSNAIFAIECIR